MLFADHVIKSTTGEMAPKEGSILPVVIWLPLSLHVCLGLVVEYWPFVGACTRHSYSKLYSLCQCLLSYLIKLLATEVAIITLSECLHYQGKTGYF